MIVKLCILAFESQCSAYVDSRHVIVRPTLSHARVNARNRDLATVKTRLLACAISRPRSAGEAAAVVVVAAAAVVVSAIDILKRILE